MTSQLSAPEQWRIFLPTPRVLNSDSNSIRFLNPWQLNGHWIQLDSESINLKWDRLKSEMWDDHAIKTAVSVLNATRTLPIRQDFRDAALLFPIFIGCLTPWTSVRTTPSQSLGVESNVRLEYQSALTAWTNATRRWISKFKNPFFFFLPPTKFQKKKKRKEKLITEPMQEHKSEMLISKSCTLL